MKKKLLCLCFAALTALPLFSEEGLRLTFSPERYSKSERLPEGWELKGKLFTAKPSYEVVYDRELRMNVLRIEANRASGAILYDITGVLQKYPIMRWKWRVDSLPKGADGRKEEVDDQAVVVYFGDGTLIRQKSVGYRWECNTPIGRSALLKYAAGMMTVKAFCVRNRTTPVGEWITEEHDVVADFRAAYGRDPNDYFIISVGANSQYSGSDTRAEIDFIEFVPRRAERRAHEEKQK